MKVLTFGLKSKLILWQKKQYLLILFFVNKAVRDTDYFRLRSEPPVSVCRRDKADLDLSERENTAVTDERDEKPVQEK